MTGIISVLESSFFSKIGPWLKENILSSGNDMDFSEKLSISGSMLLRGMATVFLVLIILWGIIAIFGAFSKLPAKKKASAAEPEKAPEAIPEAQTDDTEIVAAIMAAVETFRADEGLGTMPYRVVSFKKRGQKSRRNED